MGNRKEILIMLRVLRYWTFFEIASIADIEADKKDLVKFSKILKEENSWLEFQRAFANLGNNVKIEKATPNSEYKGKKINLILRRFSQEMLITFDPSSTEKPFEYEII